MFDPDYELDRACGDAWRARAFPVYLWDYGVVLATGFAPWSCLVLEVVGPWPEVPRPVDFGRENPGVLVVNPAGGAWMLRASGVSMDLLTTNSWLGSGPFSLRVQYRIRISGRPTPFTPIPEPV